MTGIDEFSIQSITPVYDKNNSYYIYTSEGYNRAIEKIDAEKRDIAEAEARAETEQRLDFEEIERVEAMKRENDKLFLQQIREKEEEMERQMAEADDYIIDNTPLPGSNLDILG